MAKTEWRECKLDDLGFVGRGKSRHRPRNEASLYGGKYPFFQTGDIKATDFHLTEYSQTYSEKGLAQSKLWQPGTLCITIAANIAETAILGIPGCFPDSVVGFVADPEKADVRFVKYFIDTLKLQMQSVSRGTTQDNLSVDKLLTFDFRVPSLPTQRKIAAILSAYDDLIENNERRIRILEEMAQNLYREWFVKFRFPMLRSDGSYAGQADPKKIKMVDSPLGKIPQGWEAVKIRDVCAIQRGRSYRGIDLADTGGLPFLNLKCIEREGGFRLDGLKRYSGDYKDNQTAKAGNIIVAVTDMTQERRIVARAARVPKTSEDVYVMSMDLVKIVPNAGIGNSYLYAMLRFSGFPDEVKQHANGVNVLHLSPDRIADFQFALPTANFRDTFDEFATAIHADCDSLNQKNVILRQTRDLLLPRLISGELDVSELDIKITE